MASQTRSPSDIINVSSFDIDWLAPGQANVSDDFYAFANFTPFTLDENTDPLRATQFGFTIPTGSTIDGIEFRCERSVDQLNGAVDFSVLIVKGGTPTGTDQRTFTFFPTSDAYQTFGSPTDKWGETWTAANINASDFGVQLVAGEASLGTGPTARVDHMELTVYYTPPGVGGLAFSTNVF